MDRTMSALDAITSVVDRGTFSQGGTATVQPDPLGWQYPEPYLEQLAKDREATGVDGAVVWGSARIGGEKAVLIASDFRFRGGSLGIVEAATVCRAMEQAVEEKAPAIWLICSAGPRLQEGVHPLLGLGHIARARNRLAESHVPFVAVATRLVSGVASICASQADVLLGVEDTLFGLLGPKAVELTTAAPLPPGFQTVEYGFSNGQLDAVVSMADLRNTVVRLLGSLGAQSLRTDAVTPQAPLPTPQAKDSWESVQASRSGEPAVRDLLAQMADSFFELHGDRVNRDDPAVLGGIARIGGTPVMIIGYDSSGREDTERAIAHNYAMPHPSGFRKALRLVQIAERLRLPILTLIDTPGVCPTTRSESEGVSGCVGRLLAAMLDVPVPTVGIILGQGASAAALPFATTDHLIMMDESWYSVVTPEGAAASIWQDPAKAPDAAAALQLTAQALKEQGVVDHVVPRQPEGCTLSEVLKPLILGYFYQAGEPSLNCEKRVRIAL